MPNLRTMKTAYFPLVVAALLGSACGGSVSERRETIDADTLTSELAIGGGAKAVIERAYTGGATGDTLHKAWICQASLADCQLQATVDTHDGPPPIWRTTPSGLELMIGPNDVIWDFSNFSYLPGGNGVRIRVFERAG